MSEWQRLLVCFELETPIHIGYLPNNPGTVAAPTRLYVPGKNLWGAITSALTPRMFATPAPRDFEAIGQDVRDNCAFSYFYLSDGNDVFLPSYEDGPLTWSGRKDTEFRAMFLDSRVSTEIGGTGSAEDGSLHEIEFVRHRVGSQTAGLQPVRLSGMLWARTDGTLGRWSVSIDGEDVNLRSLDSDRSQMRLLDSLTVGGERNYGFGRIRRVPVPTSVRQQLKATWPDEPDVSFLQQRPLPAHAAYRPNLPFRGHIEIVGSRAYPTNRGHSYEGPGSAISTSSHCFAPGTCLLSDKCSVTLDHFGLLLIN